ncbi:Nucleolin [Tupaia chinensis]|uniref:Nucleolin n=1 Tax=Tupaia chinensis TaxID=246437 RepID=L9KQ89_TUPCH|nr:Nucleolin [Tupaia chinensis]
MFSTPSPNFNSEEDAKAAKEAMEGGEIDGNKVTLDWAKSKGEGGFEVRGGRKGGLEAEVEAEVDLVAEAEEALEGEVASEEAEEEEETTSHKERTTLNRLSVSLSSLFHLKERTQGFLFCYLLTDRAF